MVFLKREKCTCEVGHRLRVLVCFLFPENKWKDPLAPIRIRAPNRPPGVGILREVIVSPCQGITSTITLR